MVVSPALASLRVSWNQRFAQSETTWASGIRRCPSELSIFNLTRSEPSRAPLNFVVSGGETRFLDMGFACLGLWNFSDVTTLANSWSLVVVGSDFPIKQTEGEREGKWSENFGIRFSFFLLLFIYFFSFFFGKAYLVFSVVNDWARKPTVLVLDRY